MKEKVKGKATVIKVDGTTTKLDHRPTLEEAQEIVGGYIELVKVGGNKTLVVDEDGRIKNKKQNDKATSILQASFIGPVTNIVGDVIVLEGWRTVVF